MNRIAFGGPGWHVEGSADECKEQVSELVRVGLLTHAARDQLFDMIDRIDDSQTPTATPHTE